MLHELISFIRISRYQKNFSNPISDFKKWSIKFHIQSTGNRMITSHPYQHLFNFPHSSSQIRYVKNLKPSDRFSNVEGEENAMDRIYPLRILPDRRENLGTIPKLFRTVPPLKNEFYVSRIFNFTPNVENLRKYQFQTLFRLQFYPKLQNLPSHFQSQKKLSLPAIPTPIYDQLPPYNPNYSTVIIDHKNSDLINRIFQTVSFTWKSTVHTISNWIHNFILNIKKILKWDRN